MSACCTGNCRHSGHDDQSKATPSCLLGMRFSPQRRASKNVTDINLQFTPYFSFSASVILYVYTIQHSKEPEEVYRPYLAAAERCQQQIMKVAGEGSLTSRYCVVLEELRAEAVRQIAPAAAAPEERPAQQPYSTMDARAEEVEPFSSNMGGLPAGFSITSPGLAAMGQLDDLHVSPGDSLGDLTGWGQFDSMVGTQSIMNSGCQTANEARF